MRNFDPELMEKVRSWEKEIEEREAKEKAKLEPKIDENVQSSQLIPVYNEDEKQNKESDENGSQIIDYGRAWEIYDEVLVPQFQGYYRPFLTLIK